MGCILCSVLLYLIVKQSQYRIFVLCLIVVTCAGFYHRQCYLAFDRDNLATVADEVWRSGLVRGTVCGPVEQLRNQARARHEDPWQSVFELEVTALRN